MTLMSGLHLFFFFLEMSKKDWPRFRVRNSTYNLFQNQKSSNTAFYLENTTTDIYRKKKDF
jgi:hypothetical protein